MLIEALSKLAHGCGAESISIEIPPSDGNTIQVMVVTRLGHSARVVSDAKHGALLAALAQPLVVQGHPGEIDDRLLRLVDEVEQGMVAAAGMLPETESQKYLKALKEADKGSGSAKAEGSEKKEDVATAGTAGGNGGGADEEQESDAFATDDADSL